MTVYWSYDTVTFGIYVVAVIVLIISALVHVYSLLMAKLMRSFRKQKMGPPGPPGPAGATGNTGLIGAPASIFTIRGVLSSIEDLPNPEHEDELDAYIIKGNVHVNIRLNPLSDDLPRLEWQNAGPIIKFEGI